MNTLPNIKQFKNCGELFLQSLIEELTALGLPITNLKSDHLCFRVETEEQYENYRSFLNDEARFLTESMVNGRSISTYLLKEPFTVGSHTVPLVELPAPKCGMKHKLGFDHAEFILTESFDSFSRKFPDLPFSRSGNKNINAELCLKTKAGEAKFHHVPLDRIIEIEQAKFKDIIFDFDGTLIRSKETIYEINRIVFSQVLGRTVSLEESKQKFHTEFSKLFEAFEVECPEKKSLALSNWGRVSEKFTYELFDGVKDFLHRLHNQGFALHLWTARDEISARTILSHHNLTPYFTSLSFATSIDSKPHSNSLVFDWKSAKRNSVLVIGDSPSDIFGAKNIGAIGVAAMWDHHVHEHSLIHAGAELFFHEIKELESWLFSKAGEK